MYVLNVLYMIIYVYIRNEEEKNKKCIIKEIKKLNI